MRESIVKQNDASEEIGQEEADQEGELEPLPLGHTIPDLGCLPVCLSVQVLVSTCSLGLL